MLDENEPSWGKIMNKKLPYYCHPLVPKISDKKLLDNCDEPFKEQNGSDIGQKEFRTQVLQNGMYCDNDSLDVEYTSSEDIRDKNPSYFDPSAAMESHKMSYNLFDIPFAKQTASETRRKSCSDLNVKHMRKLKQQTMMSKDIIRKTYSDSIIVHTSSFQDSGKLGWEGSLLDKLHSTMNKESLPFCHSYAEHTDSGIKLKIGKQSYPPCNEYLDSQKEQVSSDSTYLLRPRLRSTVA